MADDSTLSVIAGAIPVVGSVISGLINNANTDSNNAENRAFQAQQQEQQNIYNTNQWNAQNAYNAPAAQMARYTAAGLNPNLIYGQADSSVATAAPLAVASRYVAQARVPVDYGQALSSGVTAYNNTRLTDAAVPKTEADTANTREDTTLKAAQAGLTESQTTGQDQTNDLIKPLADSNIAKNNADAASAIVQANYTAFMKQFNADLVSSETEKNKADTDMTISSNVRAAVMQATTIKEAVQRIALDAQQQATSAADSLKIKQEADLILGSKTLQNMDVSMRMQGKQPNDSAPYRAVQSIWNWLTNKLGSSSPSDDLKQRYPNLYH